MKFMKFMVKSPVSPSKTPPEKLSAQATAVHLSPPSPEGWRVQVLGLQGPQRDGKVGDKSYGWLISWKNRKKHMHDFLGVPPILGNLYICNLVLRNHGSCMRISAFYGWKRMISAMFYQITGYYRMVSKKDDICHRSSELWEIHQQE